MTSIRATVRSGVFWQVIAGFALGTIGTIGTIASHDATAEWQPAHLRPASHWRIAR